MGKDSLEGRVRISIAAPKAIAQAFPPCYTVIDNFLPSFNDSISIPEYVRSSPVTAETHLIGIYEDVLEPPPGCLGFLFSRKVDYVHVATVAKEKCGLIDSFCRFGRPETEVLQEADDLRKKFPLARIYSEWNLDVYCRHCLPTMDTVARTITQTTPFAINVRLCAEQPKQFSSKKPSY